MRDWDRLNHPNVQVRREAASRIAASMGGTVAWDDVEGKPSTFTPSTHSHAVSDVTGLAASLASIPADPPSDGSQYARQGDSWVAVPQFITLVKSADETKTLNVAWVADGDLVSPTLDTNSVYRFELMLITQAGANSDFAFRVARTGLSDATLTYAGDLDAANAATITWNAQQNIAGSGASAAPRSGNYIGYILTGGNPGTVVIEWRQQTSNAEETKLLRGSMMMLRKVA